MGVSNEMDIYSVKKFSSKKQVFWTNAKNTHSQSEKIYFVKNLLLEYSNMKIVAQFPWIAKKLFYFLLQIVKLTNFKGGVGLQENKAG